MKTLIIGNSRVIFRQATATALAVLGLLVTQFDAQAADTWSGGGANSSWNTAANWNTVPGNNDGVLADSTDIATFGTTTAAGNGTILSPIGIDLNRNIESISYTSLNSTAGFVIGSTTGNTLYLTSTGSISVGTVINQQVINAPLVIGASGSTSVYTIKDQSTTISAGLNIGGTITGGGGTGSLALTFGAIGGGGGAFNTVSGVISDGGVSDATSITVSGVSDEGGGDYWKFSGNNTYSGGTNVTAGVLVIGNSNALGSGQLKITTGSFETDGGNYTIANNLEWAVSGSAYVGFMGSGNLTVNGLTSFLNVSQKYFNIGTGTLTLAGGVNLSATGATVTTDSLMGTGTTVISANTLISDNGAAGTTLQYVGSGTLDIQGHAASTGAWQFGGGTIIFDYSVDTGTKIGSGILNLGGVNLQLYGGSGTQVVSATSFDLGGQVNITQTGGGTEIISLGGISNGSGGTGVTSVNFQTAVATTSSATTNGTNVAGSLLGSSAYYVVGAQGAADWAAVSSTSIVSFTSANTAGYTALAAGTTTGTNMQVTNGLTTTAADTINTLKIIAPDAGADTLSLGNTLTFGTSGGILDSTTSTTNGYTISGASIAEGATAFTVQQYGNAALTINSVISGSTVLQKAGPGTLILGGANTFTGAIAINQGTLSASSAGNLGAATAIDIDGGTLEASSTFSLLSNQLFNLGVDGGTIQVDSGATLTIAGVIANESHTVTTASALIKTGSGTLVLSAVNTYAGGTYLNGGTLEAGIASATGTLTSGAAALANPFVISNNALYDINGFNQWTGPLDLISGTIQNSGGGSPVIHAFSYTVQSGTISAVLADYGTGLGGGGIESNLVKVGSGTVVLSGANIYSGGTEINGGVLQVDATETANTSGPLGGGNYVDNLSGGISFGGGTLQYVNSVNTFDYSSRIVNSTSAISIDTNGGSVTFATALASTNTGGLTLDDTAGSPGKLTLSAANLFTGPTSVIAGTLDLNNSLALQQSTVATGGTGIVFDSGVTAKAFTFGGLSGSANLALQNNAGTPAAIALTVGANNASTSYTGALTAAGSLTKTGTGTLTLGGANSYSGGTNINSGTIALATGGTLGSTSGAVSVNGGILDTKGIAATVGAITLGATAGSSIQDTGAIVALHAASMAWNGGGSLAFDLSTSDNTTNVLALTAALTKGTAGTFNINLSGGLNTIGTDYQLITFTNSGSFSVADFSAINTGLSAGLTGTLVLNAHSLDFDVTAAPEPGTWAMMLGGMVLLVCLQVRRRNVSLSRE